MKQQPKERPILFNAEMVRAVLDGRKTQTRRVIKPQPACGCIYEMNGNGNKAIHWNGDREKPLYVPVKPNSADHRLPCPYGQPGDRLWIRETWAELAPIFAPVYRADYSENDDQPPWRPSIHMPKKYSRIMLEVTGVRVERLQKISGKDAKAEGTSANHTQFNALKAAEHVYWFRGVWNKINAERGFGWLSNPWVWVVEFRVLT